MRKTKIRILSYLILITFILSSVIGSIGLIPVYAEENKPLLELDNQNEIQSAEGQAIRGIPELTSKPATVEDIKYLNSGNNRSISLVRLPVLNSNKLFYVYNSDTGLYDEINANLKRIGAHSYIYLEEGNTTVTDDMLDDTVTEFEKIYSTNISVFGTPPDIDNDKRINIMLLDIRDSSAESYIAGFFDSTNQLPRINNNNISTSQSNECEIFFMDVNEGLPENPYKQLNFFGTLAHEFQHMTQYGTYLKNYTYTNMMEETWLNEALSCLSEYINYNEHPWGQIEEFLSDYAGSGYGLVDWEDNSLSSYGASYMFVLYMYEKLGDNFISDLAADPETGIDSINGQLIANNFNITFDELFEKSQVAIAADCGDGEFGYSTINIPTLRQTSYDGTSYSDMRFYSLSNSEIYDGTPIPINTYSGKYRSYAGFFDGTKSNSAINVSFTNSDGSYYIVKPAQANVIANTYSTFTEAPKTIEKIKPDTADGNIIEFGDNQWAMLIYIAKDQAIDNPITITEVAAPVEDAAPTIPGNVTAAWDYNNVTLNWSPSSFTMGIIGYNVYRNNIKVNSSLIQTTTYTDLNVVPNTSYNYAVEAVGQGGILGTKSAPVYGNTLTTPDLNAPTAPIISFIETGIDDITTAVYLGVNLTPSNSTDIARYEIVTQLNGMEDTAYNVDLSTSEYYLPNLQSGNTYTIYAFAVDTSENYSPASNKIYVKAGTGLVSITTPPTAPTNVTASMIKETEITLQWTASTQSEGILEYNIYRDGVFVGKSAGNATQYTDSGLVWNVEYSYTIEAVGNDPKNLNSELSTFYRVTTLSVPPTLTPDTTENSVDNNLELKFSDNSLWRGSISAIEVDGFALGSANYSISEGVITINSKAIPTAASHIVSVIADGYFDAEVVQTLTAGATSATISTASANQSLSLGSTGTITLTAKDQCGNVIAGHQFYMNITITNNTTTKNESYTVGGTPYAASATNIVAGSITDLNGQATVQVVIPGTVDSNDGISIQFILTAAGSNVGDPISYTRTISTGGGPRGGGGGGSPSTTTVVPTVVPNEITVTTKAIDDQINNTTNNVVINAAGTSNEKTVVIMADALKALDSKNKSMSINTNQASLTFTPELAGSDISNLTNDSSLKVSINKLNSDTLLGTLPSIPNENKNGLFRVGSSVFQFEAQLVGKDKTTDLTSFNTDITITLSLKDSDLSEIDTEKLGVYYFNEKSKVWEYVGGKYDPATKTITFKTNHFSYYTIMRYEKSYSDITGHWAQTDIEKLASRNIFKNIAEEQFNPNAKITRSEFIAMLVRTLELKSTDIEPVAFKDIAKDKYYYSEVMTAWKLGITTGDDTGKFRPGDNITREQLAAMIARALVYLNKSPNLTEAQINGKLSAYTDKDSISSFARNAMAIALEKKIINGWKSDLLAPKENATRAEAAVMLKRLLGGL